MHSISIHQVQLLLQVNHNRNFEHLVPRHRQGDQPRPVYGCVRGGNEHVRPEDAPDGHETHPHGPERSDPARWQRSSRSEEAGLQVSGEI